jgi:hypothetical protein
MRSEMDEETMQEDINDYQRKIDKNNKNFAAATKRQKNPLSNKKVLQGADFAAQRRKERLASSGRMDESSQDAPFNKPYNKDSGTTTDKSGAKHTPMSKARHLARQAMNKTADKPVKESASEPTEGEMKGKQGYSRKAQIVRDAAGKGKKSDNPDKFQKDPELSSEIHKT